MNVNKNSDKNIYDVIIVGGGASGLSAGVYTGRSLLKTAIINSGGIGGQANSTQEIENYIGFQNISGKELMRKFYEHSLEFGVEFIDDFVIDVDFNGKVKEIICKSGRIYYSKTIIISTGAKPRKLDILGEDKFKGRGVSYCGICDAPFYGNLNVCVIGSGDTAIEEAIYISKFAKNVCVIVLHDEGILDCNKKTAKKAMENPKISWVYNSVPKEVVGNKKVSGLIIENVITKEIGQIECRGVFFFVGTTPNTEFLVNKINLDEEGYIVTNDVMESDVDGVYGVGDCRKKYLRQVITAVSDGAIAATNAQKYLF